MTKNMGWQPDREPKGNLPKEVIYLCDKKKECNKSFGCGLDCKHTTDIRHAVNFISLGDGIYFKERPEQKWIPCSKRLPEEGEAVLTQAKFKDDVKMAVSARVDFNYWTGWCTREIDIVAWMPLPKPYEVKK